jgi:uncharacterized surface protein with fasciclin (FAS1) repeats
MKTPLPTITAIGMMAALTPLHQASAQGEPGAPTPVMPSPAAGPDAVAPTVPERGAGGPEAVELDPEMTQSKPTGKMGAVPQTDLTIPEIVAGAADFTTLAGALKAAGLNESLKADGPFTLLAPDNEAFAALPEGVLPVLMKPGNVELLRKILTYHVIPKKVTATEMAAGNYISSLGEPITVDGGAEGELTIQEAGFGTTDVMAENGVIHAIGKVLIPPSVNIGEYSLEKEAATTLKEAAEVEEEEAEPEPDTVIENTIEVETE